MTWKVVETVVFFDGYSNKIYAFISMHFSPYSWILVLLLCSLADLDRLDLNKLSIRQIIVKWLHQLGIQADKPQTHRCTDRGPLINRLPQRLQMWA